MKFELETLPRNCPDEDVIAEIKRVDLLVGKDKLTQVDYNKHAKMSSDGVKLRFGNWEKALIAAGLGNKYVGTKITDKIRQQKAKYLTDQEVLDELKRVATIPNLSHSRVQTNFNKNAITMADFDKNSEIAHGTFITRFGGWHNALKKAGLEHRYSGKVVTEKMRGPRVKALSNDDVIQELQRIAKFLNKETVTHEDIRNYSDVMSVGVVARRFGSWNAAMEKAGLKVTYYRFSDEDYFENLLNVWTQHGKQPKYRELDAPPSKISAAAYVSRFGNWHRALETFVERMNQDGREVEQVFKEEKSITQPEVAGRVEIIKPKPRIFIEDRRDIGLGLRYQVLSRDKFKCVRCGASPATDPTCKLHIDHVVPFSKGGRTMLENLQTLCEMCNLGKGNRHSE